MLRRLGGLVVIAAACLVLGIVAAVGNLRVIGTATLPPGTVLEGTCIGPVDSPIEHQVSPGAGEGEQIWETATYAYPVAAVADCGQPHAGRVLSVDFTADAPASGTMPQFDALDAACQKQVDTLMTARGLSQFVDRRASGTIAWNPVVDVSGRTVGPSPGARAEGERWSACTMIASTGPLGSTLGPVPGTCLDTDDPDALAAIGTGDLAYGTVMSCSQPHSVQVLARAGMVGGSPSEADALASCQDAAQQFTGLPASAFAGRLTLSVVGHTYPDCVVRAVDAGRLGGSLLGLGDAAVPWVS